MNIAKYWALGAATGANGMTVRVWRGSNDCPQQAAQLAAAAAQEVALRLDKQPEGDLDAQHYVYQRRNVPEELITTYPAMDGSILAAITRNRYGALVLNTADVAIIDADVDWAYHRKSSFFNWFAKQADPFEKRLDQIRQAAAKFPDTHFRIYRTHAGFRIIVASERVLPGSELTGEWFLAFAADANYRNLCLYQKSFRARLTPKPRNMKIATPSVFYPYSHQTQIEFESWLNQYQQQSKAYQVCEFIERQGPDRFDPEAQFLIQLHDQACGIDQELPLA